jgi:hypothetical protein
MVSDEARVLAQARRRTARRCVICGAPIEGPARKQYCSSNCRTLAARARGRWSRQATDDAAPVASHGETKQSGVATSRSGLGPVMGQGQGQGQGLVVDRSDDDWERDWERRWWHEVTVWRMRSAWWAARAGVAGPTAIDALWYRKHGWRLLAGLVLGPALGAAGIWLFGVARAEPGLAGLVFLAVGLVGFGAWIAWNCLRSACLWFAVVCEAQARANEARLTAEREAWQASRLPWNRGKQTTGR